MPRLSWTQPLCVECWHKRHPDRLATRVIDAGPETCCDCGMTTNMGIYFRVDPTTVAHPRYKED